MLEFFRTVAGRTFFDGSVPRLIKALERIATALEASKPAPPKPTEVYVTLETLQVIKVEMLDVHYPPNGHSAARKAYLNGAREATDKFMQLAEEMAHVPF